MFGERGYPRISTVSFKACSGQCGLDLIGPEEGARKLGYGESSVAKQSGITIICFSKN